MYNSNITTTCLFIIFDTIIKYKLSFYMLYALLDQHLSNSDWTIFSGDPSKRHTAGGIVSVSMVP